MSAPATGSLVDLLQLSTITPKKPPRPQRKQQRPFHRWMTEELNLISYLRLHRSWSWGQIQRTFFSSASAAAVRLAYTYIPAKERIHRASEASSLIVSPVAVANLRRGASHKIYTSTSSPKRGPSQSTSTISSSLQTGNDVQLVVLATPSIEDGWATSANNSTTSRYNLRPNRPKSFRKSRSPCLIDRSRFPHLTKAYESHWKQHKAPDKDYSPPSRSPTLGSSNYSPSVTLSQLSDVSSLELFGLEVRPVSLPDFDPSIIPSSPSDEFLSAEEYPASP